jgi:hypothetical protein
MSTKTARQAYNENAAEARRLALAITKYIDGHTAMHSVDSPAAGLTVDWGDVGDMAEIRDGLKGVVEFITEEEV